MRKLRKLCFLLIFIVLIILGGTKALLWYYTDKVAKDIQNTLPPGMFNYTGISTSLKGSTSIDNILLSISGQNIKVEKIELKANNIIDLLILIAKNFRSKVPEELTLRIQGINIDTTALLTNKQIADNLAYQATIPCGRIKKIGLLEYIDMGYDTLTLDIDLAYKKVSNTRLKATLDANLRGASQLSLTYYGDTSLINPVTNKDNNKNKIPEFSMSIKKDTFQNKLYSYCAKQENKPLDVYLKDLPPYYNSALINQETAAAFNLVLSKEIINALNEYEKNPKELFISLTPKGDMTFTNLQEMDESAVIELTQPVLKINNKNIPINFEWKSPEALARKKAQNGNYQKPITQSPDRVLTPINKLNKKAFNKLIEVHTTSGIVYKGAFKKVEGDTLYMVIHKSWGTSDLGLKTNTIRLVYILSDI